MSIASATRPVKYWDPHRGTLGLPDLRPPGYEFDYGATAGAIAGRYQDAAERGFGSAVSGLQNLVGSLGDSPYYSNLEASLKGSFGALDKNSESLYDVYGSLDEPRNRLAGYADQLGSLGGSVNTIVEGVNPVFEALGGINAGLRGVQDRLGTNFGRLDDIDSALSGISGDLSPLARDGSNIQPYLKSAAENAYQMNRFSRRAADAAGNITNSVNRVNRSANQITNAADSLGAYSPLLKEYGQSMFAAGRGLIGQGSGFIQDARDLMGMDASRGGLIGEYINALSAIDPNQYVSMAAADVEASFRQARGQQDRALGRSGVDAGSVRSVALQQQLEQAWATASAAAKFRARRQGLAERTAAMRGAAEVANALASTGANIAGAGISSQGAGVNAVAQAADVIARQGGLYNAAGQLQVAGGNLLGLQADAYTRAGQLQGASGQLQLGAANAQIAGDRTRIDAAGAQIAAQNARTAAVAQQIANANAQTTALGQQISAQNAWLRGVNTRLEGVGLQNAIYGNQINAQNAITAAVGRQIDALRGASANEAAKIQGNVNLADVGTRAQSQQVQAATALAQAQMQAGAYYDRQATDWGKIAGTGGLFEGLFGGGLGIMGGSMTGIF